MNKKLLLLCLCFINFVYGHCYNEWENEKDGFAHPREIMISENQFAFADLYDVDSSFGHLGNVIKEKYTIWTHYDYYGSQGKNDLIAKGYLYPFSWRSFFSWASIMDIYNSTGCIGKIRGCLMTLSPSKFKFYDGEDHLLGTAFMDTNRMGFTVVCAKDDKTIAKYTRMPVPNAPDYWYLTVYENDIPPAFLILFGTFAVDTQGSFKVDN